MADKSCNHKWRLIDKTVFKSPWEQVNTYPDWVWAYTQKSEMPMDLCYFKKKSMTILACKRCGALDKTELVSETEASSVRKIGVICAGCFAPVQIIDHKGKCGECGRLVEDVNFGKVNLHGR